MALVPKLCLADVKFQYRHHQNVVMGAFRYYVIPNVGGSGLKMIAICYGVNGRVALNDYVM